MCDIECADSFFVALLPYALIGNYNIIVSDDLCISSDLLYQVKELLIPTLQLSKEFGIFHEIEIKANTIEGYRTGKGCGTGFSRGVDSFYTLLRNMEMINYLFLFNDQAYGVEGGDIAGKLFKEDLIEAKEALDTYNTIYDKKVKLIAVSTNIHEEFKIRVGYAGTYRDAAIVILFRKGIGKYLYSSGSTIELFDIGYCRTYESWLLPCLSSGGQKIYSYGNSKSRFEKLEYISDFRITYDYLSVCRKAAWEAEKGRSYDMSFPNCTKYCYKCKDTCLALKGMGKLDYYHKRFDIQWIIQHEKQIVEELKTESEDKYHALAFDHLQAYLKGGEENE